MLALSVAPVSAHSPIIAEGNDSIDRAILIVDPSKSWAVFSHLPRGGSAQFYRLDMLEGEQLHFILQISPDSKERGFSPLIAIIGPGMPDPPEGLPFEVPAGSGALLIEGVPADTASYEGFTPSVFHRVVSYSSPTPATGTYYLAVFGEIPGSYSLAIGYKEEFTPYEWIMIPVSQLQIYLWSGQSPLTVFAPMALIVAIGALLIWKMRAVELGVPPKGLITVASLLYIGTGATILSQIAYASRWVELGPEVGITLVFAALPVLLGALALRKAKSWSPSIRTRFTFFTLGVLGILFWGGVIIGPVMMMIASILPGRTSGMRLG
ncbi:MAG: hypothetical protein WHS82_07255 [Candidatus Methanosuratincola sp.]